MANESLGKLGYAAANHANDTTQTALAADASGSAIFTRLGTDFEATFDSVTGADSIGLGNTETYTANFTGTPSFTSRIKVDTGHYVWALDPAAYGTLTPNGATCDVENDSGADADGTLSCTFNDHFNGSTLRQKVIHFNP